MSIFRIEWKVEELFFLILGMVYVIGYIVAGCLGKFVVIIKLGEVIKFGCSCFDFIFCFKEVIGC